MVSSADDVHQDRTVSFPKVEQDASERAFLLRLLPEPVLPVASGDGIFGALLGQPARELGGDALRPGGGVRRTRASTRRAVLRRSHECGSVGVLALWWSARGRQ